MPPVTGSEEDTPLYVSIYLVLSGFPFAHVYVAL